jgi:uncharacterized repeat protein (TIGR03899 family)
MEDLFGLGKSTDKILDAVSKAVGALYRPYGIKREADAEAYRQLTLGKAQVEAKAEEIRVIARAEADKTILLAKTKEELKERAQKRKEIEELREQQNIDQVVQAAINAGTSLESTEEVDPDWINSFFTFAKSVTREQMQDVWGRILAKEIGQPGSFSIRSLEILKRMTLREMESFATACKLAASYSAEMPRAIIVDGFYRDSSSLWSIPKLPVKIELYKFGLDVLEQTDLASIGVLYEDELVSGEFRRESELYFAKSVLVLTPRKRKLYTTYLQLTPAGVELSNLLDKEEDASYLANLKENLVSGFIVKELPRND